MDNKTLAVELLKLAREIKRAPGGLGKCYKALDNLEMAVEGLDTVSISTWGIRTAIGSVRASLEAYAQKVKREIDQKWRPRPARRPAGHGTGPAVRRT